MKRRIFLPAVAAALLLAACGPKDQSKRYPMNGVVKAIDPGAKTATIEAGKIGDWMDAMTMEYSVKPDSELAKMHPGDRIQATVVVNDLKYYVTDVKVLPPQ